MCDSFLVVMHVFALGGVASRYSTLVQEMSRLGGRCTAIGVGGPAQEVCEWGDANLVALERWDAASADQLTSQVGSHDLTLWALTPETVPLLPLLAIAKHAVLGVHGYAALMTEWLGETRLTLVRSVLSENPHIGVVVPGTNYVDGVRLMLGISPERCVVLPHAVSISDRPATAEESRSIQRVLCPTRLSAEQRYLVRAAADLAEEGAAELTVVGVGPDAAWVRDFLKNRQGLRSVVVEDGDVRSWIQRAEVVVAVGLTALEAAAAGCVVVTATRGSGGGILDVVTVRSWNRLWRDNFLSIDDPPISPSEAWRRVGMLTPGVREHLRRLVVNAAAPEVALATLREAGGRTARGREVSASTHALMRAWLDVHVAFDDLRAWLTQVGDARDYFRERSERFESMLAERES